MKTIITLSVAFAMMVFSHSAKAQLMNDTTGNLSKDSCTAFTLFTARYFEGKTYLHWDVVNQTSNGMYIVYRSFDGKKYEPIGHKKGIGVPVTFPIAYYIQDEHPFQGETYYRVIHISSEKTFLLSSSVRVFVEPVLLSRMK